MIGIVIRRFLEMLITCVLCSAIAVVFNITGLITTKFSVFILILLSAACWFLLNVYMLRRCYFGLRNKRIYYISNFTAYTFFGLCTVIVYLCFSNAVYGWLFAIAKFLKYTKFDISTVQSTALFHLLGGLMILWAPAGMEWIFLLDEDE